MELFSVEVFKSICFYDIYLLTWQCTWSFTKYYSNLCYFPRSLSTVPFNSTRAGPGKIMKFGSRATGYFSTLRGSHLQVLTPTYATPELWSFCLELSFLEPSRASLYHSWHSDFSSQVTSSGGLTQFLPLLTPSLPCRSLVLCSFQHWLEFFKFIYLLTGCTGSLLLPWVQAFSSCSEREFLLLWSRD